MYEILTFNELLQFGVKNDLEGSFITFRTLRLKSMSTQSIINVIRYGGLPNFLTVAMSVALIVYN